MLSPEKFEKYIDEISRTTENFLLIKHSKYGILRIIQDEYKPVYHEIIEYNKKIDKASRLDTLNAIKTELYNRYDIPNRHFLADVIERKRRTIGSKSLTENKFIVEFDGFLEKSKTESQELYKLLNIKYHGNFNPAIRKVELLSDIGESDFHLTMEKVTVGGGRFNLIFKFRGKVDNSIYNFLNENNIEQT